MTTITGVAWSSSITASIFRRAFCLDRLPIGFARAARDRLAELDPCFDRAAKRARARDAGQPLELRGGEIAAELDRDVELARGGVVVVVDGHAYVAELPALRASVLHERHGDAGSKRGGEELVRRRAAALAAQVLRLVGDQAVLTVDHDLLTEGAGDRTGCRGETHLSANSLLAACDQAIGAPAERGADKYAAE